LGVAIPDVLLEEHLKPMDMGQIEAAPKLGVSLNRLNEIVRGNLRRDGAR
jgi:plasmid maintenance system antidote protein VapI